MLLIAYLLVRLVSVEFITIEVILMASYRLRLLLNPFTACSLSMIEQFNTLMLRSSVSQSVRTH